MTVQLLDTWENLLGRSWQQDASTDPWRETRMSPSLRQSEDDKHTARLTRKAEEVLHDFGVTLSAGALLRETDITPERPWDRSEARARLATLLTENADIDWERPAEGGEQR